MCQWIILIRLYIYSLVRQLYMDRKTIRCFCQHENGGAERNGILCGITDEESGIAEAGYQKVGNCEMNEWCTGPTNANQSVEGAISHSKRKLCTKGSYKFFIMSFYKTPTWKT